MPIEAQFPALRTFALDGHLKPPRTARSLSFFRYLRSLYPTDVRLSIVHNYTLVLAQAVTRRTGAAPHVVGCR